MHATFPARRVAAAKAEYPQAKVAAHPECPPAVLAMADFIGSTSAIIDFCARSEAEEFIVMTESGVSHSLHKLAPASGSTLWPTRTATAASAPYMKLNTLEKLRDCLRDLAPRVELSDSLMARAAVVPLERMLAVK